MSTVLLASSHVHLWTFKMLQHLIKLWNYRQNIVFFNRQSSMNTAMWTGSSLLWKTYSTDINVSDGSDHFKPNPNQTSVFCTALVVTLSCCRCSVSVLKTRLTGDSEFIVCSMSFSHVIARLKFSWKLSAVFTASSSWLRRPATLDWMLSQRIFNVSRFCCRPTVDCAGIFDSNDSPFTCNERTLGSYWSTVFNRSYNSQHAMWCMVLPCNIWMDKILL